MSVIKRELALQQWRERTDPYLKLEPWWSPGEQQMSAGTETEQMVTKDIAEFPVIDAKDILEHLKQNRPVSKSSSSDALSANFEKKQGEENDQKKEGEEENTKTEKWKRHAVALQEWRMATKDHWTRYGLVHKQHQKYMQQCGQGPSSDGARKQPALTQLAKKAGPHALGEKDRQCGCCAGTCEQCRPELGPRRGGHVSLPGHPALS